MSWQFPLKFRDVEDVQNWLIGFEHSLLPTMWASTPNWVALKEEQHIEIRLPFVSRDIELTLTQWIADQRQCGVISEETRVDVMTNVEALKPGNDQLVVPGVKNLIAVSSGKGGVGKSTMSVNLALALQHLGAKVGLLDGDIYGPSVPLMLGSQDKRPVTVNGKQMKPITAHGLATQSIGYLVDAEKATVWRGPMAAKALQQILRETFWPDLDYLVVDLPPGTGDIQLTLAQQLPVNGAVVVTTPQDLALADAIKGVAMFEKVDVAVLGVIENMSYHICSECGHHDAIFGEGGAEKLAKQYQLSVLAQVPLAMTIREDLDKGTPTVVRDPQDPHSQRFIELAEQVASRLYWQSEAIPATLSVAKV
ncbi:Iron-sulfur cluster carrier protein [Vibrio stylophorae]|uniref:Iron-sulfur cluster carrier protein n=1 Tax=Vibrio stylophorae TaxID=659351 RepID=A0ABN8DT11_9VIBR|nr:iron-sulfur cluster carrier protein ApbC [Vibrio stylophorae]CAH0533055.1 Iron-sulfur cluster carrier protein [Vibrio stylophorae]